MFFINQDLGLKNIRPFPGKSFKIKKFFNEAQVCFKIKRG